MDTAAQLRHGKRRSGRCIGFLCHYRCDESKPLSATNEAVLLLLECASAADVAVLTAHRGFQLQPATEVTVVHFTPPAIQQLCADWVTDTTARGIRHVSLQVVTPKGLNGICPVHHGAPVAYRAAVSWVSLVTKLFHDR